MTNALKKEIQGSEKDRRTATLQSSPAHSPSTSSNQQGSTEFGLKTVGQSTSPVPCSKVRPRGRPVMTEGQPRTAGDLWGWAPANSSTLYHSHRALQCTKAHQKHKLSTWHTPHHSLIAPRTPFLHSLLICLPLQASECVSPDLAWLLGPRT